MTFKADAGTPAAVSGILPSTTSYNLFGLAAPMYFINSFSARFNENLTPGSQGYGFTFFEDSIPLLQGPTITSRQVSQLLRILPLFV